MYNETMTMFKNSKSHDIAVELHIKHNNLGRKQHEQGTEEEEAEDSNSCTSKEEIDENKNNM